MRANDLDKLDRLLDRATAVVSMREVYAGATDPRIIGLRHDVDNTIDEAVDFAQWEFERGYRATYFILHNAPYWADKDRLQIALRMIQVFGHEIGIHNSALSDAAVTGDDPRLALCEAILELESYGHDIVGTVAHGAPECYGDDGRVRVVNDEMFRECARPELGPPDRAVGATTIRPESLAEYGLDYDANWIGRDSYLSDSGGSWSPPGFDMVAQSWPGIGQLHLLVHPCHWTAAFSTKGVAA